MIRKRRFEWHPPKAEKNRRVHGISFELAKLAFDDVFAKTEIEGYEHGEERWRTTGAVGAALIVISHTAREEGETEIIRIISARRAEPDERRCFEEEA